MPKLSTLAASLTLAALGATLAARAAPEEKLDLATIHRIKAEAFDSGQVMDHLFWLTDVNGPRLTNSPGWRSAADWAIKTLRGWGASEPRLEKWGTFGRGWSMSRFSAHLISPSYAPLSGVPKAWSGGTDGPVSGELLLAPIMLRTDRGDRSDLARLEEHLRKFIARQRGKLRGKIVLLEEARELELPKEPPVIRLEDPRMAAAVAPQELVPATRLEWPLTKLPPDRKKRRALLERLPLEIAMDYFERQQRAWYPLWTFLREEGALAAFVTDERGDGGLVFAESTSAWDPKAPVPPPVIVLAPEAYNRLARLAEKKVTAKVELDLRVAFHDEDHAGYNVLAELPGTNKKNEVVMLGAHLDSWHGGTGATDNAAGTAVILEAFRILKTLNLPLQRTVRLALWSGEEQGLLGSRGYVKEHFADPITMSLKPEHATLAAYFNLDNGTGKVRGVYLQGNDMARPLFEKWLLPFKDLGATALSIRKAIGTDNFSFDSVGLPGFQFIQDPLDYFSRTHHSDLDVSEHVQAGDLMQASAILASFVYNAATQPEMLPRKPLPKPLPAKKVSPESGEPPH
jgi:carboxypeptidase Q